jgi:mannosyltransferase
MGARTRGRFRSVRAAPRPASVGVAIVPWWERRRALVLTGLVVLALGLDLTGPSRWPLWADEASTYWTARASFWAIASGQGADGTPPLYFLILHGAIGILGWSELALRVPSILAGLALVPATYVVMRRWSSLRVALIAAGLTVASPLVHYYAVEARNYALVQLETVGIIYAFALVTAMPARAQFWMLLAAMQAAQLLTHVYGAFFLLAPILATLLVGSDESRVRRLVGCLVTAMVALAVSEPWIRAAVAGSTSGVGDWIRTWWLAIPPSRALLTSLELFGFGGRFPRYLTYLGLAPSVGLLSIAASLGLMAVAMAPWRPRKGTSPGVGRALLAMVSAPLLAAWIYSLVRQPLYLPGRYDTIALPPFLMLLAVGLDRLGEIRRWAGVAAASLLVVLAALSWAPVFGPEQDSDWKDHAAGVALARRGQASDKVVSLRLRKPVTAYYAARGGFAGEITSFPSEVDAHPGWYSADRLRQDPNRLAADGHAVAAELVRAAREGHGVWIVGEDPTDIDHALLDPLFEEMDIDEAASDSESALVRLQLRPPH